MGANPIWKSRVKSISPLRIRLESRAYLSYVVTVCKERGISSRDKGSTVSQPATATATVSCPFCSKIVTVLRSSIVIDDEASVYRMPCPVCDITLEKQLTLEVRQVLRNAGVRTLEELLTVFRSTLYGDQEDQSLWHTMYDVAYRPKNDKGQG